jgi:small subunit ribosomal protein S18
MADFGERREERRNDRSDRSDRGDRGRKLAAPMQTQCRFCRRREEYVDYKDIETLQKLLTHRGKIYSRKRSGNCAGCQRKVKRAIKRARYMALLPFTA